MELRKLKTNKENRGLRDALESREIILAVRQGYRAAVHAPVLDRIGIKTRGFLDGIPYRLLDELKLEDCKYLSLGIYKTFTKEYEPIFSEFIVIKDELVLLEVIKKWVRDFTRGSSMEKFSYLLELRDLLDESEYHLAGNEFETPLIFVLSSLAKLELKREDYQLDEKEIKTLEEFKEGLKYLFGKLVPEEINPLKSLAGKIGNFIPARPLVPYIKNGFKLDKLDKEELEELKKYLLEF